MRVTAKCNSDGSVELYVDNIAKPQKTIFPGNKRNEWTSSRDRTGTAFAQMINDGTWVDAKAFIETGFEKPAPKREARPFWDATADELGGTLPSIVEESILNNI